MKVFYRKKFLKELAKIPEKYRKQIETFVFEDAIQLKSIAESNKIEKMTGYQSYYKIRFGPYRVGLKCENDQITFERVLHRKDIYRFFP